MTPNEYQNKSHSFATGGGDTLAYALLGLCEEVGELIEKTNLGLHVESFTEIRDIILAAKSIGAEAKRVRKRWTEMNGCAKDEYRKVACEDGAVGEVGDILWMLANVAHHMGVGLDAVMTCNIAKLEERKATGTICGSGETIAERLANNEG